MSSEHVLVPVPQNLVGQVYAVMAMGELGVDRLIKFAERYRDAGKAAEIIAPAVARETEEEYQKRHQALGGPGPIFSPEPEATVDEPDPVDRLPELVDIATENKADRMWAAFETLGTQDKEKLQTLFEMLCEGTRTMSDLDVIDGDYGVTWKRIKRLAAACSKKGVRTPVRHSTKQGTTYVFFTGVRNGLDA